MRRRWIVWTVLALALLALGAFGLWRWAVAAGSAATLEWIDARFPRDGEVRLAAQGSYGTHPAQRAELWVPAGQAFAETTGGDTGSIRHPLVVFVHGGAWRIGSPEEYRFVARTLGEAGFATALVGYRLVPEGRFPAMLEDTAAAIAWVRERAPCAGVRTDRIALSGHSAGAYNVLMMGLDPQWLRAAGVPAETIGGIVSLAGPADFYPFTSDSAKNAMGHVAEPRTTQPVAFARADATPLLLLHGTEDTVVRVRNARRLAAALRKVGGEVEVREYEGMGHAGVIMGLSKPFAQGGIVRDPMIDFLRGATAPASVPVQRENR
jgi:acetyl esterase/lipase